MIQSSLTHRYIPRIQREEENMFMEEYYSSTDTTIYFDDKEHTEIGYISYSMQEQLKPLFGYASRTWDDVAIGARTVTGTFKIPIKNTEAQSSIKQIEKKGAGKLKLDYGSDNTPVEEWVPGTEGDAVIDDGEDTIPPDDDETYEYRLKLMDLYPDLDYNSDGSTFRNVVRKFQQDNNLDQTGELNAQTKKAIDNKFKKKNGTIINVSKNTKLYNGPAETYDYILVDADMTATVINEEFDDGWKYVMLSNGKEGYVKT